MKIALHFDTEEGDPNYNPEVDINGLYHGHRNGRIDISDIVLVAIYLGESV